MNRSSPDVRPTRAVLDLGALAHNLKILKSWMRHDFFCPMVKANAYGHGDLLVAKAVESSGLASAVGVALIEEGVRLRAQGVKLPLLVFAPFAQNGASAMLEHRLTPVVSREEDLRALKTAMERWSQTRNSSRDKISIHLKFNTGMQRLGFAESELEWLKAELKAAPGLDVQGLCTHLTHGHDVSQAEGPSQKQIRRFLRMSEGFPGLRHLHKSASLATLEGQEFYLGAFGARPGIGLYGLPHEGSLTGRNLRPVLSWVSELVRVHEVEAGEGVGYNSCWVAPRRSWVGIVPVGYADGYRRAWGGKAQMLWRGARVPVVGTVCMDYTLVDLTEVVSCGQGTPQTGETVTLLGRQGGGEITAFELAEKAETNSYDVVTGISTRVRREVL